jgi:diguanylate cyclase
MDPMLTRLADSLARADGLETLARPMLEMLARITGMESVYFTRIDPVARRQHVVFALNTCALEIPEGLDVDWSDTLCRRALEEGRAVVEDVSACWPEAGAARDLGIQTYLGQPVQGADGRLYGTLCAASASRGTVSAEAQKVLGLFARILALHLDRERYIALLRRNNAALAADALTDPLTGIPNRRALLESLQQSLAQPARAGRGVAVAFIDLDGFKSVNDRLGHDAGDRFLVEVARRLSDAARAGETVARYGGDEFVVVSEVAPPDELESRLARAIAGRYELAGVRIDYAGASIGTTTARADEPAEAVLARADAAMYEAKEARRRQREAAGGDGDCHFVVEGPNGPSKRAALPSHPAR